MLGDESMDFDGDAAAGTSAGAGIGGCCGAAGGLDFVACIRFVRTYTNNLPANTNI